ncbi:MAG: heme oxygenase (biliverdin-producing) [Beutenbergiaceae bacterium]
MADSNDIPFSQQLREATQQAHTDAESSSFVGRLMSGACQRQEFIEYTAQLLPVYQALEREGASDHERARFDDPRLHRVAALQADLEYLLGPGWRDRVRPLPVTAEYAAHIDAIRASTPAFVGHHYTRYLGDLSGGRIIARKVGEHYGLTEGQPGLLFYAFGQIAKPKAFKDSYRRALDTAEWNPSQRQEVITEARHAFAMNQAIFAALGQRT